MSAIEQGLQGCPICTSVGPAEKTRCTRCGSKLHAGWANSIQHTWAWLVTSVVLYLPANFLPITYTRFLGKETESTILGGVVALWEHGSEPIAIIISVQFGSNFLLPQKTRLYRITEFVGRWSMIDVFVVSILVALIQLGNVMTILPGVAALAFAAMVVATMLAALAFDPRLLWVSVERDDRV